MSFSLFWYVVGSEVGVGETPGEEERVREEEMEVGEGY